MPKIPKMPTKAIETLVRSAGALEKQCALQQIELRRHGLILNANISSVRTELKEAVEELVEELDELAEELAELVEELEED